MANEFVIYEDQLKDARWLEFRERVISADGGKCIVCGSDKNLNAHHDHYNKGKQAWEYRLTEVVTLCRRCHETHHKMQETAEELLLHTVRRLKFDWEMIFALVEVACTSINHEHSRYKTAYRERLKRVSGFREKGQKP